jgi:hypothetical protein
MPKPSTAITNKTQCKARELRAIPQIAMHTSHSQIDPKKRRICKLQLQRACRRREYSVTSQRYSGTGYLGRLSVNPFSLLSLTSLFARRSCCLALFMLGCVRPHTHMSIRWRVVMGIGAPLRLLGRCGVFFFFFCITPCFMLAKPRMPWNAI